MKNVSISTVSKTVKAAALFVLVSSLSSTVMAQKLGRNSEMLNTMPKFFIAVESGAGTTSLTFKSDIKGLQGFKYKSTGWNVGLIGGDDAIKLRVNYGSYSYQKSSTESIDQKILSAKINVSPVKLFKEIKYFRMYFITGADFSTFSFQGIDIPKYKDPYLVELAKKEKCCCETGGPPADPGAPPADPGAPTADESGSDSGKTELVNPKNISLKKTQIDTGLGFEITTTKRGKFYRMFAEAHYGIPLGEIVNDLSLSKTSVSSQLVINVGLSLGIGR